MNITKNTTESSEDLYLEKIQEEIKNAAIKWSSEFHKASLDMLAGPIGLKKHHSNKMVSSWSFVSEERIKKVANLSHRLLKSYKIIVLKTLLKEYTAILSDKNKIGNKLKIEMSRPWWSRSRRYIKALQLEYHTLESNVQILNGIEHLMHTVPPDLEHISQVHTAEPIELKQSKEV